MKTQKSKTDYSEQRHLNIKNLKERDEEITRVFNGMPVVDAKHDLRVSIMDVDIKKGKPKDFDNCVFAQACKRLFSSQKVLLMRTIAYISLPDDQGNYRVERFMISPEGRKLIAEFDTGIMPKPKTSFVFAAPSPGRTLEAKSNKEKRSRKLKRQARINGEIDGSVKIPTQRKIMSEKVIDVRDGTGLIQMSRPNGKG